MSKECLVCDAPIMYVDAETDMTCSICGKTEGSKCCCVNGHFVCNECHASGLDEFFAVCMSESSKNPIEIFKKLTDLSFCHMNGPEHHVLVGAALLTAYKNAGGNIDLAAALKEMNVRGKKVPGGVCGFWGTCGAAISTGQYMSIITDANPLAKDVWGKCNTATATALKSIGDVGGPRCCKRNGRLAIIKAVELTKEFTGIQMELPSSIECDRQADNKQCIGRQCPFRKNNNTPITPESAA